MDNPIQNGNNANYNDKICNRNSVSDLCVTPNLYFTGKNNNTSETSMIGNSLSSNVADCSDLEGRIARHRINCSNRDFNANSNNNLINHNYGTVSKYINDRTKEFTNIGQSNSLPTRNTNNYNTNHISDSAVNDSSNVKDHHSLVSNKFSVTSINNYNNNVNTKKNNSSNSRNSGNSGSTRQSVTSNSMNQKRFNNNYIINEKNVNSVAPSNNSIVAYNNEYAQNSAVVNGNSERSNVQLSSRNNMYLNSYEGITQINNSGNASNDSRHNSIMNYTSKNDKISGVESKLVTNGNNIDAQVYAANNNREGLNKNCSTVMSNINNKNLLNNNQSLLVSDNGNRKSMEVYTSNSSIGSISSNSGAALSNNFNNARSSIRNNNTVRRSNGSLVSNTISNNSANCIGGNEDLSNNNDLIFNNTSNKRSNLSNNGSYISNDSKRSSVVSGNHSYIVNRNAINRSSNHLINNARDNTMSNNTYKDLPCQAINSAGTVVSSNVNNFDYISTISNNNRNYCSISMANLSHSNSDNSNNNNNNNIVTTNRRYVASVNNNNNNDNNLTGNDYMETVSTNNINTSNKNVLEGKIDYMATLSNNNNNYRKINRNNIAGDNVDYITSISRNNSNPMYVKIEKHNSNNNIKNSSLPSFDTIMPDDSVSQIIPSNAYNIKNYCNFRNDHQKHHQINEQDFFTPIAETPMPPYMYSMPDSAEIFDAEQNEEENNNILKALKIQSTDVKDEKQNQALQENEKDKESFSNTKNDEDNNAKKEEHQKKKKVFILRSFIGGFILLLLTILIILISLNAFSGEKTISECENKTTEWTKWSSCDTFCSFGHKYRYRELQPDYIRDNEVRENCLLMLKEEKECFGSCNLFIFTAPSDDTNFVQTRELGFCKHVFSQALARAMNINPNRLKLSEDKRDHSMNMELTTIEFYATPNVDRNINDLIIQDPQNDYVYKNVLNELNGKLEVATSRLREDLSSCIAKDSFAVVISTSIQDANDFESERRVLKKIWPSEVPMPSKKNKVGVSPPIEINDNTIKPQLPPKCRCPEGYIYDESGKRCTMYFGEGKPPLHLC